MYKPHQESLKDTNRRTFIFNLNQLGVWQLTKGKFHQNHLSKESVDLSKIRQSKHTYI